MDNNNRILIISATPFRSDTNLGKTLCTLFSAFNSDEMAQLYTSPQVPNTKLCNSYYQINEKQLIKSGLGLIRGRCGRIINSEEISIKYKMVETNPRTILSLRKHVIISILRDLLWDVSLWKSTKIRKWLDEVKPKTVFCIMPGNIKNGKIIDFVAHYCNCPIVMFVTDDYYNITENNPGFLRRWWHHRLQQAIDKMAKRVKYVIGCSELAAEEFGEKYNVPYEAIFTPSGEEYLAMPIHNQSDSKPVVFRYFGNLGLERWKPLAELGRAIASYNKGEKKALLEVYASSMYPDAIAQLDINNGCVFKGWVHGEEYMRLLHEADVAVHVESFSDEMCRRTRLSVSTKIADYLGAGKCIFAIGRSDLASIKHIQCVAQIVSNPDDLRENLVRIVEDREFRTQLSYKARDLANSRHNIRAIPSKFRNILCCVND